MSGSGRWGPPRPMLVAAGCDPALPLLGSPLGLLDPPVGFTWWPCPSREALGLAAGGLVHVAGAHLRGRGGEYNIAPAAELLPQGGEVIGFCSWREGLVLRPELASGVAGVADVTHRGLRLVNREPGAEARNLLDRELADLGIDAGQLPGYQHPGHRASGGRRGDRLGTCRRRGGERARGSGLRASLCPARRGAFRSGHPGRAGWHPRGARLVEDPFLTVAA